MADSEVESDAAAETVGTEFLESEGEEDDLLLRAESGEDVRKACETLGWHDSSFSPPMITTWISFLFAFIFFFFSFLFFLIFFPSFFLSFPSFLEKKGKKKRGKPLW